MSEFMVNSGASLMPPVDAPFSLPFAENLTGDQFGPANGALDYCTNPNTVASQYRLATGEGFPFIPYTIELDGITVPAYCLEFGVTGPAPGQNEIYQSELFEDLLPGVPTAARYAVNWLVANAYPAVSAECTFAMAGVDAVAVPPLDDADAYAVVQTAIWRALFQVMPNEIWFLDCVTGLPHAKNPRLVATVNSLVNRARAFGEVVECARCSQQGKGCDRKVSKDCPVRCCGMDVFPENPAEPYITFMGCPCDTRFECGRLMIGPLVLDSNLTGVPAVTAVPLGVCEDRLLLGEAVDFCGAPIPPPDFGEEFYLSIQVPDDVLGLNLVATISDPTVTQVNILGNLGPERLQRLGAALTCQCVAATTVVTMDIREQWRDKEECWDERESARGDDRGEAPAEQATRNSRPNGQKLGREAVKTARGGATGAARGNARDGADADTNTNININNMPFNWSALWGMNPWNMMQMPYGNMQCQTGQGMPYPNMPYQNMAYQDMQYQNARYQDRSYSGEANPFKPCCDEPREPSPFHPCCDRKEPGMGRPCCDRREPSPFHPCCNLERMSPFHPCCEGDRMGGYGEMEDDVRVYRGNRRRRER